MSLVTDHLDRYGYRNTKVLLIGAATKEVTVSPKYRILTPKEIREPMSIVSAQKVQLMSNQRRVA